MKKFSFPQFTLSLKTRLIAGSLAISVLSLLLAIGAVIFMINKQQTTAAHALIKNALTIMTDELRARQEKLFADTRQLAQMEGISTKIKFLLPQKMQFNDVSMLNTYQELTNAVYNIGVTANASKMAIYDRDGDVAAFMLKRPTDMVIGYASGFPSPVFQILTATSGNAPQNESWRAETVVAGIAPTFGRPIPEREQTRVEQLDQEICFVAYVPVMGQIFDKETRKMETKQLGVAVAIQPLDEAFISRMARLTNTAPQIFTPQGVSVGEIPDYRAFDWERLPSARRHRRKPLHAGRSPARADRLFHGARTPSGNAARARHAAAYGQSASIAVERRRGDARPLGGTDHCVVCRPAPNA